MADWNHVHSIARARDNPSTSNGGDYGNFALLINNNSTKTLYEHYKQADHHHHSDLIFDYEVKELN